MIEYPELMITVTLRPEQWQAAIDLMGYAPFRAAAPLIQEIVRQINSAQQRPFSMPDARPDARRPLRPVAETTESPFPAPAEQPKSA